MKYITTIIFITELIKLEKQSKLWIDEIIHQKTKYGSQFNRIFQGYWDGYDTEVNPDVIDAFAAAAYRFGHSLLPTAVERWSKAHKFIGTNIITKNYWKLYIYT